MSIKSDLRTLLKAQTAITGTLADVAGIYVLNAPQDAKLPHIVLTTTSTDYMAALDGTPTLKFEDLDIDCKAQSQAKAEDTLDAVAEFMDDYTGAAGDSTIRASVIQGQGDDYVPDGEGKDTGTYFETLELTLQYE